MEDLELDAVAVDVLGIAFDFIRAVLAAGLDEEQTRRLADVLVKRAIDFSGE